MNTPGRLTQRAEFYEQLASCIQAGVTIVEALTMIAIRPTGTRTGINLRSVLDGLQRGLNFAEAMRHSEGAPPEFDLTLIEAGENSGRLDQTLRSLASHYRDQATMLRTVIVGLAYPMFIAHVAILIFPISFLTGLVWDGKILPFLIQKLLVVLPLYGIIFGIFWALQNDRAATIRASVESVLSRIPVLGGARRELALSRLASTLHAQVSSGVLLIPAWEMAGAACGSPALHRTISGWKRALQNGATPAELVQRSAEFPAMFVSVYTSGEISGKLEESLAQLQRHYQEEGSRRLRNFMWTLVFAVYMGIMMLVAWQIISFWLGYFNQINDVMK